MSFYIQSKMNGKVLDVWEGKAQEGIRVKMFQKNSPPSQNQLWHFEPTYDGHFYIVSELNHSLVLDIEGGATQGAKLIVWNKNGGANQKFIWHGGEVRSASGLILDIHGSNSNNGAEVCAWPHNGGSNQQWEACRH